MIYCCIAIDYLSQLERAGVREAGIFVDELRTIALSLGASVSARKTPLVVEFPSTGSFHGIQTAEALRRFVATIAAYAGRLRGASMAVHEAGSADEASTFSDSMRRRDDSVYSFSISREARESLARYFNADAEGDVWSDPVHWTFLADADAGRLFRRPRLELIIAKAAARPENRRIRLVHLDAGPGARSIESLAAGLGSPRAPVLILAGAKSRPLPFSPLVEAISAAARYEENTPTQGKADESAYRFVETSAFSCGTPESVAKGCAHFLDRWLDRFGSDGGVLICDSPDRFSPEAVELIGRRLSESTGTERYLSVSDGGPFDQWAGPWAARVPADQAGSDDDAGATIAALGSSEGAVREALSSRFADLAGSGTGAGNAGLFAIMPQETKLYLYALAVAENELSSPEFSEFAAGLGLRPEGERLVRNLLAKAGLVDPIDTRTPVEPVDTAALATSIGPEAVELIDRLFAAYLIGLYRAGRIRPSLGFLRRVGERAEEERLLYDCLFEEVLRPDRPGRVDSSFLSPSSASAFRFWSALMARDRPASEAAAAAAEERITGPRSQAVRALVRAELAYSAGDAERASRGAREALLALGKGAPPKLEARSQRMMGLAALAMDKHTEAVDYLTNAQELSETAGDEYERMMAAFAKANVEFLSGALVRSMKAATCAEESASRLFRIDVGAAVEALRGRIDLELGAYDEAARRFAALGALAREYAIPGAENRAALWRGRALAYAREYDEAVAILEAGTDDPEALIFRGELEILRGRPRDARAWLQEPAEPVLRPFGPPDSFDWSSLFSEMEGRCMGFDSADASLSEFRTALSLFARGLDERDPACAVELYELTRAERASKINPAIGTYNFFCYLLEERLPEPPVDKQTVLSRAFKTLQQRAGRLEDRAQRALYMEKNAWNKRLLEAARTHKFI